MTESAKLGDTAEAFGLTGEAASRLFGIMASGGSDLRDATEGIVTFNQRVEDSLAGTGEEAQKLFEGLGVDASAFDGLDSAEKFYKLLEVLRQVPDPAKRVQLLLKAVGEDTGKNLIPLLSMSADQVEQLGDAFQQSGADLAAAREAQRAYTLATAQLGQVWREAVGAIAPIVAGVAEQVSKFAKPVAEFVGRNREAIGIVLAVAAGLAVAGAALVAFGATAAAAGAAIAGAVAIVKGLVIAVGLLLNPITLAVAAVAAIGYLFVTQTEEGAEFFAWIKSGFQGIADVFQEAWGGITAALKKGDLALAGQIALKGLEVVWRQLMVTLTTTWVGFKNVFVDTFRLIVAGTKMAWEDLTGWIGKMLARALDENLAKLAFVTRLIGATGAAASIDEFREGLPSAAEIDALTEANKKGIARDLLNTLEASKRDRMQEILDAESRLAGANAELAALVGAAKSPDLLGAIAGAAGAIAGAANRIDMGARRASSLLSGSQGTFTAVAAAQRLSTLDAKHIKAAESTAKNTEKTAKGVEGIAKGLVLR